MDIAVLLLGTGVVVAWFVLAAVLALLAGRVICYRDVRDLPIDHIVRLLQPATAPR